MGSSGLSGLGGIKNERGGKVRSGFSRKKKDDGQIGIITLNRPDALNTFNIDLARDLDQSLRDLDEDKDARVIIINGAGRCFSAGIDVTPEIFGSMNASEYYEWITLMERPIATISKLKKPVIASVHGFAVANGIGMVAGCDLAISEEGTRFGATAINVGLNCIGPQVSLYRNIGKKNSGIGIKGKPDRRHGSRKNRFN